MPKTKLTRILVEGATVDGRTVDRAWIDQMAAGYDPATYTARLNCEHIRGFSPEPPFNAYGSVDSLVAQDCELKIDGKPTRLRALYGVIDANDQLIAINKKGQKLFTSCEISDNFAGTKKAGLVGLAVTDNPASLGTEMLEFAAKAKVNPLSARKQDPSNFISAAEELSIEFDDTEPDGDSEVTKLAKGIASFFTNFGKTPDEPASPPPPPPAPANDNQALARLAAESGKLAGVVEKLCGTIDTMSAKVAAVEAKQTELSTSIESTDDGKPSRSLSTGGAGHALADF